MADLLVLAFVRAWSLERERPEAMRQIRAELRGLGAELLVLSDAGVWSCRPDDAFDRLDAYKDRPAGDAIFVIDDTGKIRFSHRQEGSLAGELAASLTAASDALLAKPPTGMTRREWATNCLVAGFALTLLRGCKQASPPIERTAEAAAPRPANQIDIVLEVNGKRHPMRVEPRVSLLDALRERIGLTGTKKGCDMGQCGACTVLIDGRRVLSCLTLAVTAHDHPVTTIEGLAKPKTERDGFTPSRGDDELHPVQVAFVEHDAFQCGYCTPGQIMSAVALTEELATRTASDDDIREQMSGNICRCGAYPNIVAAIRSVMRGKS